MTDANRHFQYTRRRARETARDSTFLCLASGLALAALALPPQVAQAQDADAATPQLPNLADWACEFCPFESGWRGDITFGLGHVSDDSFKFGEYNGLNEDGGYAIAAANATYWGEDTTYLDLSFADFGLDSRSLRIAGGAQGSYDLYLRYDQIPHFISDSAATPYLGSGGDVLTLPAGWITAGTTAGMTALAGSLREFDLETERKRLGVGVAVKTESPWSFRVDARSDDKEGSKRGGGAFFFRGAQLAEPVDYETQEFDASVAYTRKRWQAKLAYYASTFDNANESLTWDNAFTPIAAGADSGRLALPPDNEFQQVALSAAYQISARNHLSGSYAVGRMEQDERLLQATINPNLLPVVPALPGESTNAEIDTTNARLALASTLTDRLRLSAALSRDERDNQTPQLMYDWVTTDAFIATQRTNLPYSYTRDSLKLKADYDYGGGVRLGVGYDHDERERTFQEVDKTDEGTLWGTIRLRGSETVFLEFKLAASERDASAHGVVAAIDPPQNALMRKYNQADRDRAAISMFVSFLPAPDYTIGVAIENARDDYDDSELGLTDSLDNSVNIDVAAMLTETTSLSGFVGLQKVSSSQAGSQSFAGPDWSTENEDRFENYGFGITRVLVEDKLSVGIELSRSTSRGEIMIGGGAPSATFPDLKTVLDTIRIRADYRLDENLSLQASYWYEKYDSDDWALDGVEADTAANLLAFGEDSPSYSVDAIALSLSYRF